MTKPAEQKNDEKKVVSAIRRVSRLVIRNVLSIEEADIPTEGGVVARGRNGEGKTNILHAFQAVFSKHARTKMVQKGAKEGEILLVMDDGTTVQRTISDDGMQPPVVTLPDGRKLASPATFLQSLIPTMQLNPVEFLDMKPDKQAKVLAQVFAVAIPEGKLESISQGLVDLSRVDRDANGLLQAHQAYKFAFEARTEINGALKAVTSALYLDEQAIPQGFDAEAVRKLSSETLANELSQIDAFNQRRSEINKQLNEYIQEDKDCDLKVKNIEEQITALRAQQEGIKQKQNEVRIKIGKGTDYLHKNPEKDATPIRAQIQSLDQQRVVLSRYDSGQKNRTAVDDLQKKAQALDKVVKSFERLPAELVAQSKIPIQGLTLENNLVYVDGLPIDNLSEGQQLEIAVKVAMAGAGDLKMICIDGAERLDDNRCQALVDRLEKAGFQVFMTKVDENDITLSDTQGKSLGAAKLKMASEVAPAAASAPGNTKMGETQPVVEEPGIGDFTL